MTNEEIKVVLENHKHWLYQDCENWESMKADLSSADLIGANLRGADLRGADLRGANLIGVDLRGAGLSRANLRDANLSSADLIGVDLRGADLIGVDLSSADLIGANLRGADLIGVDLSSAKNVPYIPMICPEEGEFIGWKKASNKIVKLRIPADAKRSSATTRKCRCDKAEVLAIYNLDKTISDDISVRSSYNNSFIYTVGQTIEVTDFDNNRWNECSTGIHFFIQMQEAINY